MSPRVGNEGAFWKRVSGWQSPAPCPAAAGRAALAGRLQSPERHREEAACAVGGREDGAGSPAPEVAEWGGKGSANNHVPCSELVSTKYPECRCGFSGLRQNQRTAVSFHYNGNKKYFKKHTV